MIQKKLTFTPVNCIGDVCACCGRKRAPRGPRGVRVQHNTNYGSDGVYGYCEYYCNRCIDRLAKAKAHP